MARTVTYTPTQKAEALWMVDNGWTVAEVANRVGCSDATIYEWRRLRKVRKLDLPANYEPPADLRLALRRRNNDDSTAETAKPDTEQQTLDATLTPEASASASLPASLGSAWDDASLDEASMPDVAPLPALPNGGTVERADVQVLDLSNLVAELDSWRQQLIEADQRAARAEAELAKARAQLDRQERELEDLKEQLGESGEVARDAVLAERARTNHYRQVMRFEMDERDAGRSERERNTR